jgi:hypothetical protein
MSRRRLRLCTRRGDGFCLDHQTVKLGVCWYSEKDWSLVKLTAVDPERFEDNCQGWLKMAEEALQVMVGKILAERVLIDANEFAQWRNTKNQVDDADARAAFVTERSRSKWEDI